MKPTKEQQGDEEDVFETISVEADVQSLYFNNELIQPNFKLRRLNMPSGRVYFMFRDEVNESDPVLFAGTGSLERELPKGDAYEVWLGGKGYSAAKRLYYTRMLFGSFEHTLMADLAMYGTMSLDGIPERLRKYFFDAMFYVPESELRKMMIEAQKDMIAITQWVQDYKVRLVFVEFPVYSEINGMATQIDLGCFLTLSEGTRTRKDYKEYEVFALINYKSGKSGFRVEHRYQLQSEMEMFKETFPDFTDQPIRIFNLAGKKWRTNNFEKNQPYTFSDQTELVDMTDYDLTLHKAQNHFKQRLDKPINLISGDVRLGETPSGNVTTKNIYDLIASGEWKKFERTEAAIPNL